VLEGAKDFFKQSFCVHFLGETWTSKITRHLYQLASVVPKNCWTAAFYVLP